MTILEGRLAFMKVASVAYAEIKKIDLSEISAYMAGNDVATMF